jgi:hypothetical protein
MDLSDLNSAVRDGSYALPRLSAAYGADASARAFGLRDVRLPGTGSEVSAP